MKDEIVWKATLDKRSLQKDLLKNYYVLGFKKFDNIAFNVMLALHDSDIGKEIKETHLWKLY